MNRLSITGLLTAAAALCTVVAVVTPAAAMIVSGTEIHLDAHTATVSEFDGTYYLYGTSLSCGWQWQLINGPAFCGINVYRSSSIGHFRLVGRAFALTPYWRQLCASAPTGVDGCWEPRVVFDARTHTYVMWVLTDGVYTVLRSKRPDGPFYWAATVTPDLPSAMGDFVLLQDNGATFLIFSADANRRVYVEPLTSDDLALREPLLETAAVGEGTAAAVIGHRVVIVYGSLCGYCTSIATSEIDAPGPLSTYSSPKSLGSSRIQSRTLFEINGQTMIEGDEWRGSKQTMAVSAIGFTRIVL